jgi:hypothetical protein
MKRLTLVPVASVMLALAGCGPDPPPALDRLRMDVGANGALSGLVQYKTSILDSDATFIGLAEQGITTPEGVAFVVTLEPQTNGSPKSTRYTDINTALTATVTGTDVITFSRPTSVSDQRIFVLTAKKPGTASIDVSCATYSSKVTIPITVVAQK